VLFFVAPILCKLRAGDAQVNEPELSILNTIAGKISCSTRVKKGQSANKEHVGNLSLFYNVLCIAYNYLEVYLCVSVLLIGQ
jgi:hypothetical protein